MSLRWPVRATATVAHRPGFARCSYCGERRFIPGWQAGTRHDVEHYDAGGRIRQTGGCGRWIMESRIRSMLRLVARLTVRERMHRWGLSAPSVAQLERLLSDRGAARTEVPRWLR